MRAVLLAVVLGVVASAQTAPATIVVTSPALKADQPIPRDYTADGKNWSPPLAWSGLPAGTKSVAVVCEDPDAGNPPPFVHWVIYNIPPGAAGVPENIPFEPGAPMPAHKAGDSKVICETFRRFMG